MAAEDTVTGLESLPLFDIVRGAAGSPTAGGRRSGGENIGLLTGGVQFVRQDQPAGITALPAAAAAAVPTTGIATTGADLTDMIAGQPRSSLPESLRNYSAQQLWDLATAQKMTVPEYIYSQRPASELPPTGPSPMERHRPQWQLTNPDLTEMIAGVQRGALPEHLYGYTAEQLANLASGFKMTLPEFVAYESHGKARQAKTEDFRNKIAESSQRPFDEVLSELQYYKENPPTTHEDVRKANIAWRDYQQRYAQSTWNYPEMGGRPQDYSLQPIGFLPTTYAPLSDPYHPVEELPSSYTQFAPQINDFLNRLSQEASAMSNTLIGENRAFDNIRTIKETQALVEKYPEISEIINAVYSVDPNFQKFNPLDDVTIKNLASEIKQYGPRVAAAHFINRAKGLVGFGQENWYGQQTMDNPHYAAYERMLRELEPKRSDEAWEETVAKAFRGNNPKIIGDIWRDPVSGAGFALTEGRGMQFYNRAGEQAYFGGTHIKDFIEEARRLGMDLTKLDKDTRDRINAAFARSSGGNLEDYGFAEGGLARRQFINDPEFNLGMTPAAFRNLGLMGLPGAESTVANPVVMDQLKTTIPTTNNLEARAVTDIDFAGDAAPQAKTTIPTAVGPEARQVSDIDFAGDAASQVKTTVPTATGPDYQDLSDRIVSIPEVFYDHGFDTTGFKSGTKLEDVYEQFLKRKGDVDGLEYWTGKIGPTVEMDELTSFLHEAEPERQRVAALQTPDVVNVQDLYKQALGRTNVSPEELAFWSKEFGGSISPAEVERFIASAQPELTTSKYTPFSEKADTANFPKFEGRAYNPVAYDNLVNQLSGQQKALEERGFKYGSTFGGAQETIQDIAKRLASMGVSSIYDLGMKHELPVEKIYETIPGDEGGSVTVDTGKYRTIAGVKGRGSEGETEYEYRELTPDEVKKLTFKDGVGFLPIGMADRKALINTPFATTKYYNKKTGEELDTSKIGGKAESGLFASSGAGDGYTNYRVVYSADGTPVVLPEKELSGMKEFVAKDLPGILSVLRFLPGAQIPVMLAQAGAAAYMGAKPEDVLKQLATTYLASNIGKIGDKFLPQLGFDMPTSDLGKLALQSGYSGLASLIQGGDLEDALRSAGLSAAGAGISGLLPKGGDINYSRLLQAAAPALAKGRFTNADIFRLVTALARGQQTSRGR